MSYKTVLVHVDESMHACERIQLAATVAMTQHAHLIGIATTGASRYLRRMQMLAELDTNFLVHLEFLRQRAKQGLEEFSEVAEKIGMPSFETRLIDDEAGGGVSLQARYSDLVVIGQNNPQEASPIVMPDFPQYVVLHSGRPVLIIPYAGRFGHIGNRALIAWDASMTAARAIANALPLLKRAQIVQIATFNQEPQSSSGADITAYLARHGVKTEVIARQTDHEIGHALLGLANDLECDLLVMGAYGHPRFREILLGGATSTVLDTMTIPVLMSH